MVQSATRWALMARIRNDVGKLAHWSKASLHGVALPTVRVAAPAYRAGKLAVLHEFRNLGDPREHGNE